MSQHVDGDASRPPDPRDTTHWHVPGLRPGPRPVPPVDATTGDGTPASRPAPSRREPSRPDHRAAGEPDAAMDLTVRPFLLTGGRTRPARDDLRVETLIQAQREVMTTALRFEARQIYEVTRQPSSVADIAAALGVPLGVVRILISDLIADGYVTLVENKTLSTGMLERIRDRVRAL